MDRTSVMDVPEYRSYCQRCAEHQPSFNHFRQYPEITQNIDVVDGEYGGKYLAKIEKHYPLLLEHMEEFAKNDTVGAPYLYHYPQLSCSICPTTLRYVKQLGDLASLFGNMDGWRVVEIGGGYGGLSRVLSYAFDFSAYTIIDLPEPLALAKKYHEALGVPNMEYLPCAGVQEMGSFDLLISNYAFSECSKEMQQQYLEKVIRYSLRGYMVVNFNAGQYQIFPHTAEELKEKLESFGFSGWVERDEPLLHRGDEGNLLYIWNA